MNCLKDHRDARKTDLLAGEALRQDRDVHGADRRDLGVAARRLPVSQHHDGLAMAGNLDAAQDDGVRHDVGPVAVLINKRIIFIRIRIFNIIHNNSNIFSS